MFRGRIDHENSCGSEERQISLKTREPLTLDLGTASPLFLSLSVLHFNLHEMR
jgi:hypothetical protein